MRKLSSMCASSRRMRGWSYSNHSQSSSAVSGNPAPALAPVAPVKEFPALILPLSKFPAEKQKNLFGLSLAKGRIRSSWIATEKIPGVVQGWVTQIARVGISLIDIGRLWLIAQPTDETKHQDNEKKYRNMSLGLLSCSSLLLTKK